MRILTAAMTLALLAVACGEGAGEEQVLSGWEEDIAWISDSLPLLHYDLFMYQPEESLEVKLSRILERLDELGDMEVAMELTGALASMRCSHTGIAFWETCEIRAYPVSVIWLEEGLFVTAIDSAHSALVGSRLTAFDGRPAEEAASAMAGMFPATNSVAPMTRAERFMMLASCMEALGYGSAAEPVPFSFITPDGDSLELSLRALDFTYSNMVDFHNLGSVSLPVWLSSDMCYWHRHIPERKMLYCGYNSCNLMDGYSMESFVDDLQQVVDREDVEHVVVDLRRNSGGNSLVAVPLIEWLGELAEDGNHELSLIIGRWTYSSGILNALEIREIPGVTVYGEATGGAPNHLGEVRTAILPHSGLTVSYPTKYFRSVDGPGTTMLPDVSVPLTREMLFNGENRVLDAIRPADRS